MQIAKHLSADNRGSSSEAANEIKSFIDRHIYERISIEMISQHICLSPSQVTRVFKKAFEVTPYDYILSRKIDTAKLY